MQSQEEIRAAYDKASGRYARDFIGELDHKPKDREFLSRFATLVGQGNLAIDIGCGPGHTTQFLSDGGIDVTGIDLSPGMIEQARIHFPDNRFNCGDMLALDLDDESTAGVLAFYSIVNLTRQQLPTAFGEVHRVLIPGGVFLFSFHVGTETVRKESFLETGAVLDFYTFEPATIEPMLTTVGFKKIETITRAPYEAEFPTNRCYIFAFK